GGTVRQACSTDKPRTYWRYRVDRKRKPAMAAIAQTALTLAPANGTLRKNLKSTMGSARRGSEGGRPGGGGPHTPEKAENSGGTPPDPGPSRSAEGGGPERTRERNWAPGQGGGRVGAARPRRPGVRDEQRGQRHRGQADRDVRPEDAAPADRPDQYAAQHRAERHGQAEHAVPYADGAGAFGRAGEGVRDDAERRG